MIVTIFVVGLLLNIGTLCLSQCPANSKNLTRIGLTRYYIKQDLKNRGGFVTIDEARQECVDAGLKMATIKNMLAMAVLGRELEKMAFSKKMKDTWYWLDAKFDNKNQTYYWGDGGVVHYSLFLHRSPRPIGVGSHITYYGAYQKDKDLPQCLTLSLPWLGSADHHKNTTVYFGHQTTFDERDCKSKSKRHAICESSNENCSTTRSNPFTMDEDKRDYFEKGNWVFGDRKYIVNWKQRTFNESKTYCQSLGLNLMTAGAQEKYLIPHIKMWARGITAAQFWTSMKYNETSNQFLDATGKVIANQLINFTENVETRFRKTPNDKQAREFCVALSFVYEFKEQMPCTNISSLGCQWSFIRYAPANCKNYHGTICQHDDHEKRYIAWPSNFNKMDLTEILQNESLTSDFGYKSNNYVLRSKYKQTYGNCYCPQGYRMLRPNEAWAIKPNNALGREIYKYDYLESYWVSGDFNKAADSICELSVLNEDDFRHNVNVNCTEWNFYLCEKNTRRSVKKVEIKFNKAPPMKWNADPQPRIYPLIKQ